MPTSLTARIFLLLFGLCLAMPATWASDAAKGAYLGARHTEYPAWFKDSFLDLNEDIAEAASAGKRVILLFHQDNCPYCNALVERNLAQKDIETRLRQHFDVIALNMWGDREVTGLDGARHTEKSFAAGLKVQFTPTILFFDESGKTILRLNGYIPPQRFRIALDYVAERMEKTISYRDYAAAHEPAAAPSGLFKEDFFRVPPFDLRRKGSDKTRPVAVFFEQKDCPDCEVLHKRVLPDRETRSLIRRFDTVQLDMWGSEAVVTPDGRRTTAREWAKVLDVKYAPTIVLFDGRGKEIIRSEAFFKVFHTQGIFDYVLSGAYRKEPNFQRYLSGRAEVFREQGKDVDIWRLSDEPPSAP